MASKMDDAGARFKALHDAFFVMPNPWDVPSARLFAGLGFSAVATSSAALAWTLGRQDGGVTRTEAIAHAAMLASETGLPVNGDFESGYGETPAEVSDTVSAAIDQGVAGCSIEDLWTGGPDALYPFAEACRRLEAARTAIERSGAAFVLTGRCEAYLAKVDDPRSVSMKRLAAFAEFSDVLYAPGMTTPDEVAEAVSLSHRPVNVIVGLGGVSNDLAALRNAGVKRISLGSNLAKVAYGNALKSAGALLQDDVLLEAMVSSRALNGAMADR
ncbi:MAG: isocitrate lyase/phosphoenolpyruvate mutase family protein [Pseudomonadota bacterium]